jgi:hypothetical protein
MPKVEPIRPAQSRSKTADSVATARAGLGRIPRRRKPRARPPQSWRDKIGCLHGVLPTYSGPYAVSSDRGVPNGLTF